MFAGDPNPKARGHWTVTCNVEGPLSSVTTGHYLARNTTHAAAPRYRESWLFLGGPNLLVVLFH